MKDVDEIYAFGKRVGVEKAHPSDEFDYYEVWEHENIQYKIGKRHRKKEGRMSIIVDLI